VTNFISVGSLWVLCGMIHGYEVSTIHYQHVFLKILNAYEVTENGG